MLNDISLSVKRKMLLVNDKVKLVGEIFMLSAISNGIAVPFAVNEGKGFSFADPSFLCLFPFNAFKRNLDPLTIFHSLTRFVT